MTLTPALLLVGTRKSQKKTRCQDVYESESESESDVIVTHCAARWSPSINFFPSLTDASPYVQSYIDTCISQCNLQSVYGMLLLLALPVLFEPTWVCRLRARVRWL